MENKIRGYSQCSQSGARTTKFHRENIVRSIGNTNDEGSLMMNERTEENVIRTKIRTPWKMAEN